MSRAAIRNTREGYGLVAIALHWVIALLIVGQVGLGLTMMRVADKRLSFELVQWHKSLGILILALIGLRLLWRLANPRPAPLLSLRRWEKMGATGIHRSLYSIFFALPLSGWALVSTSVLRIPTLVFGLFLLPYLPVEVSETSETFWRLTHVTLAFAAMGLIGLHVLAALRHHFILKDDVLRRMLQPTRRTQA